MRLFGLIAMGLRRLRRHPLPALLLIVALSAPVAVAAGVPMYSDAASVRLLDERLGDGDVDADELDDRYAFLFSYNRLSGGNRTWAEVSPLDARFIDDPMPAGLAVERADRFVETIPFALAVGEEALSTVTFASVTGFDEMGRFVDGAAATPAAPDAGRSGSAPIEVAVEAEFANLERIAVGDRFDMLNRSAPLDDPDRRLSVEVVGIWSDGDEPGAFGNADAFRKRFVVPLETISDSLSPRVDEVIQGARWRMALDVTEISSDRVSSIVSASDELNAVATNLLPGTRRLAAPSGLRQFQDDERDLRRGLAGFSLPLLVLAAAVGLLIVSMSLRPRSSEFSMSRRRGVPSWLLIGATVTEAVVVAVGATALGIGLAFVVASTIGRTQTFFRFGDGGGLAFDIGPDTWRVAGMACALLVVAQVALSAAMIVRSGRRPAESAAQHDRPWWQRSYLDVFAVVLIAVITWRGVGADTGRSALLDDPAVILLPSATAFAIGLVVLRIMPFVMSGVARMLERTDRHAALTAARRAARVPADIAAPLLLLVITASLATFTASLAVTLDLQLLDQAHHRVGGEASFVDTGRDAPVPAAFGSEPSGEPPEIRTEHAPLDAYSSVWGVEQATATIELTGRATHDRGSIAGFSYVGVDPVSFTTTSFWRSDYADASLSELMAPLAGQADAVLVAQPLLRSEGLVVGDLLRMELITANGTTIHTATIAGRFDQFPGWAPDAESPLIVGRADTIEALAGATHDRTVMFRPGPRFDLNGRTGNDLSGIGADVGRLRSTDAIVEAQQRAPGRQGVLGLLTVGVVLATVLTLAGFVVSTVLAFRRRTTELGVLRAMGMTRREVATLALFDLATVMVLGLAIAIGLGLALSRWFIPLLVDTPPGSAPELLAAMAWSAAAVIAAILACLLAVSGVIVAATLRRVRLFEAIRLGES